MAYRNGKDALPPELLKRVQQYAAGDCLYIPRRAHAAPKCRQPSGELAQRNLEITQAYKNGQSVKSLSARYFLSPQGIYKILRKSRP